METNSRNKTPITTIKNLEDLIFHEVLPRIPAKSLLRFKTVASHWHTFITSVDFLKTHVRHLPSLKSRFVLTLDTNSSFFQFLDGKNVLFLDNGDVIASKKIGNKHNGDSICYDRLLSSCNGLAFSISVSVKIEDIAARTALENDDFLLRHFDFSYVIYNLVLGVDHFAKIPHPKENRLGGNNNHPSCHYSFGFAYVSSTQDYYIVAIDLPHGFDIVLHVYSVRSKRWKTFNATLNTKQLEESSLPFQFLGYWFTDTGTLINETLHWGFMEGKEHKFIFAYDLANHSASRFLYPKFEDHNPDLSLCCLDDCLCVWTQITQSNDNHVVEMWMLKQHQGWNSWFKLFRIKSEYHTLDFFGFTKTEQLLILTSDEELLLRDPKDPTSSPKRVLKDICDAVNYVPSLESVLSIP